MVWLVPWYSFLIFFEIQIYEKGNNKRVSAKFYEKISFSQILGIFLYIVIIIFYKTTKILTL
tara:strand:+ start:898 stop:1083 length:186 start_codon:yes stop_codon:yes gene_type:complete